MKMKPEERAATAFATGVLCTLGGAVLAIPFYGFLPLAVVMGGLFAAVAAANAIESPSDFQRRTRRPRED